jgi:hypothetical protein
MELDGTGPGTMTVLVDSNTLTNIAGGAGIEYAGAQQNFSNHANVTITNNTLTMPDANAGFGVYVHAITSSGTGSPVVVEALVSGNNVVNDTASADYRLDALKTGTTLELPGYLGGATNTSAVDAFVASHNQTNGVTSQSSDVSASAGLGGLGQFTNTPGGANPPLPQNSNP